MKPLTTRSGVRLAPASEPKTLYKTSKTTSAFFRCFLLQRSHHDLTMKIFKDFISGTYAMRDPSLDRSISSDLLFASCF